MFRAVSLATTLLLYASVASNHAAAAEIRILSPGATEGAFSELIPKFEQASGYQVTIKYGPAGALADRVSKGEAVDVAILSAPAAEELRKQGKLVDGSAVVIAKVGIGVFVRKGDPKPDVSSVNAFVAALKTAKSIAYADPTLGGSTSLLERAVMDSLDVSGSIKAKTKLTAPAKPLLDLIAGGGADFGFNPISEILPDPRVELVGPLPAPIQKYTQYVASLVTSSQKQNAFKAWVAFLSSPAAKTLMEAKGFAPP